MRFDRLKSGQGSLLSTRLFASMHLHELFLYLVVDVLFLAAISVVLLILHTVSLADQGDHWFKLLCTSLQLSDSHEEAQDFFICAPAAKLEECI